MISSVKSKKGFRFARHSQKVILLLCLVEIHRSLIFSAIFNNGLSYVWSSMFDPSKPKIGCLSSISKRWTRSSPFDVRKNDVRVCSMNNLVNLVKGFWVWCLMSVCSKPKFRCSSLIINRWTCSSLLNVQKMMFEFVRCSIKWCSNQSWAPKLVTFFFNFGHFWWIKISTN